MTGGDLLSFEDVGCRRGGRELFQQLSFAVRAGEVLLVTGPNGAGKSSLIRLAAGLLEPAAGKIFRAAPAGLLAHDLALDDARSLGDALAFWGRLDGCGADVRLAALEAMGLSQLAPVPVRFLSAGQKRRAGLARVIAGQSRLWLLDEPGVGLDAQALALLASAVASHCAGGGAVIAATHMDLGVGGARTLKLGASL